MVARTSYVVAPDLARDPHQIEHLTGNGTSAPFPPEISHPGDGGKFSPDGAPLFFPGNTFICHIDPNSVAHTALRAFSDAMKTGPAADYFTYLPASSFHMTVFPAVCGSPLGHDGWPNDIAQGTTLDEFNALYRAQLVGETAFQSCQVKPFGTFAGTSIGVTGATEHDENMLWQARELLQNVTGLKRAAFADYIFHISISYRTRWLPSDLALRHLEFVQPHFARLKNAVSSVTLGPIEFCAFENMHHFKPIAKIS